MLAQRRATHRDIAIAAQRAGHAQRAQQPNVIMLPAPVRGLNGRDSFDSMKPDDAVRLDNWVPGFGKVEVRRGSAEWAQLGTDSGGFVAATGAVETLAQWQADGAIKLIAAADGGIYDASTTGEKDTPLGDGFSNDRWQHVSMNDVLGLVNGQDAPQTYDGAALAAMTVAAAMGEPTLDVTSLIGINVYRNRSYFIRDNDPGFWFSAVNTLGGDLTYFPLGDVQGVGGHLVAMATWTRDGGTGGADDLAVFLMSSGQVVLYEGSDPDEATDWALVGVFSMARPIGRRCVIKVGGEAVVVTVDGYTQLSRVLPGGRTASDVNVSDRLGKIVLDQIRATGTEFGWQIIHYPRGRRLLVNYPTGGLHEQHAVNLTTGAWCRFRGMDAHCWSLFGDRLFFGTSTGRVVEADVGTNDIGADIVAEGQQAFTALRDPGRNKQVNALRPQLEATGGVDFDVALYADYSPVASATVHARFGVASVAGPKWNQVKWNSVKWGKPSKAVQGWIGHAARGYAISPSISLVQRNDLIAWSGILMQFTRIGILS